METNPPIHLDLYKTPPHCPSMCTSSSRAHRLPSRSSSLFVGLVTFFYFFLGSWCFLGVGSAMGTGHRHLLNNLLHHFHGVGWRKGHRHQNHPSTPTPTPMHVPKGYLAVMVGLEEEERERFVVPVAYLSHPLFMQLLKDSEDEYGLDQKGAITIPCDVGEFRYIQGLIDCELCPSSHHGSGGHSRQHHFVTSFRS